MVTVVISLLCPFPVKTEVMSPSPAHHSVVFSLGPGLEPHSSLLTGLVVLVKSFTSLGSVSHLPNGNYLHSAGLVLGLNTQKYSAN